MELDEVMRCSLSDCKGQCKFRIETGLTMFCRLSSSLCIFPTGSDQLDEIVGGGIWSGELTEVAGFPASGKTQFCYTLAALALESCPEGFIVYLDSNGSFRTARLLQILQTRFPVFDEPKLMNLLNRILIRRVSDEFELARALDDVKKTCADQKILMGIVDSVGGALALTVVGDQSVGFRHQERVSRLLKTLASDHGLAVVLVNQLVDAWTEGGARPALGQFWSSVAHSRLCFQKVSQCPIVNVKSTKSPRVSVGDSVQFRISEKGLEPVASKSEKETESLRRKRPDEDASFRSPTCPAKIGRYEDWSSPIL